MRRHLRLNKPAFVLKAAMPVVATGLVFTLLVGCTQGNKSFFALGNGAKVATVNGEVITEKMLNEQFDRMAAVMHLETDSMKSPQQQALLEMFKRMTLQTLILDTLIAQEAEKKNLKATDREVDTLMERQIAQSGGKENFQKTLKEVGVTEQDVRNQLKKEVLKEKLVNQMGGNKVEISETEARRFYDTNRKQFQHPEQVHASHILISTNTDEIRAKLQKENPKLTDKALNDKVNETLEQKKNLAESVLKQAKANPTQKNFAQLAIKYSDDSGSAKNGGDLGYFSRGDMVPSFAEASFSTKPGQLVNPTVKSPFGFHIILVHDRRAPKTLSYEEVKPQIVNMLETQAKTRILQTWVANARQSAKIEIEPEYRMDKNQPANAVPQRPAESN